ncbi:hypothetical protein M5K25_004489 [Dendrobium thyrsiflorum]|uniref:BTB/POZ domain-containing protein n=1 Tax=Dendrobium thyrsiflorum TaxID=117978 RepID=A0ABD0VLT1_DENTH
MATVKLGSKAEAFHLDGHSWICNTELPSDIVIEIGDISFHLHKFPLLNRSGLLKKLIGEYQDENGKGCLLQLHDLPGGARIFELVAKFCYDVKIELNSFNVAALRCAAEDLCMIEEYFGGNLISQTENFLNEIFGNWKDSMKVLETCEDLLPLAEELHIVTRCINSLAMKACADPNLFGWPMSARSSMKSSDGNILWNGISTAEKPKAIESDWWYEDSSSLSFPLYKRLILSMESKGMKAENIGGSLIFYAKKYFRGLSRNSSFHDGTSRLNPVPPVSALSESDQRVLLEEIVGLLPTEKGSHPWLTDSEREQLCRLMNCQKLSLEACTHAAQNERLPLRVVVQVLFFEQLRLRTSVAGWFFVSENMENIDVASGNLIQPKTTERLPDNEIMQEEKDDMPLMETIDMRQRIAELEKECKNMKQEIEKLGKPKSTWGSICKRFPRLGFGSRSEHQSSQT